MNPTVGVRYSEADGAADPRVAASDKELHVPLHEGLLDVAQGTIQPLVLDGSVRN